MKEISIQQARARVLSSAGTSSDGQDDQAWHTVTDALDPSSAAYTLRACLETGVDQAGALQLRPGATYEVRLRGGDQDGWGR